MTLVQVFRWNHSDLPSCICVKECYRYVVSSDKLLILTRSWGFGGRVRQHHPASLQWRRSGGYVVSVAYVDLLGHAPASDPLGIVREWLPAIYPPALDYFKSSALGLIQVMSSLTLCSGILSSSRPRAFLTLSTGRASPVLSSKAPWVSSSPSIVWVSCQQRLLV